jgi:prepilin-type N-terminal cleavage/methylation domain-containing protein
MEAAAGERGKRKTMAGRRGESGRRGMTLIELLVVIMIIGILIGLLLPGVHAAMVAAKITQVRSDLRQVETVLRQYVTHLDMFPTTRQYTAPGQYDLDYCLPQELFPKDLWGSGTNPNGTGYLDGPLADPFQVVRSGFLNAQQMELARGYRYKALGAVSVNGAAATGFLAFNVPANFPKSGGAVTTYTYADWFKAPVRLIIWSAGPGGPPVKTCYTTDGVNAEDPANWYPERPNGIICLYYDGNDWLFSY